MATNLLFPLASDPSPEGVARAQRDSLPTLGYALSATGTVVGAYHGFKRNDSVGWAIVWALLGGAFPLIVVPVALAQGIGEKK
jgi:hypothetical protein